MIDVAAFEIDGTAHLRLRVGIHSGPVIGGVIGNRKAAFDIWGETVNLASRLEAHGIAGRVHASAATWHLVEGQFTGMPRGPVELRGYGPTETYTIDGRDGSKKRADTDASPVASGFAI
jgi:adenylate cyclase